MEENKRVIKYGRPINAVKIKITIVLDDTKSLSVN